MRGRRRHKVEEGVDTRMIAARGKQPGGGIPHVEAAIGSAEQVCRELNLEQEPIAVNYRSPLVETAGVSGEDRALRS